MQMSVSTALAAVLVVLAIQNSTAIDFEVSVAWGTAYTKEAGQPAKPSCVNFWRQNETAEVICRSAGYKSLRSSSFEIMSDVSKVKLKCEGGEAKIQDCDAAYNVHCRSGLRIDCDH